MNQPTLEALCALVKEAAREALLPRFADTARRKADGSLVTEADFAMQHLVREALQRAYPQIPLLGEEMPSEEQRELLEREGVELWCLDPLDGTSNFAASIPYFSVSLALVDELGARMGLVYDPTRDECFTAVRGEGAACNGVPLVAGRRGPTSLEETVAVVDFKRLPSTLAARLGAAAPYSSQRSFGSVALDWCWLAAGRGHLYLHGKQKIWDYAAGHLIFSEAGGHSQTLDGEPLFQLSLAPRSAVAALDAGLFRLWAGWLRSNIE